MLAGWIASGLLMREWLRRESPLLQQVCGMVIDSAPLSRVRGQTLDAAHAGPGRQG